MTSVCQLPHPCRTKARFVLVPVDLPLLSTAPSINWFQVSICRACAQSCPTLYDPMDCSPPGSSVKGILQTRILEWLPFPSCICQVDNSSNLVLITPAVMTDDLIRKSLVTHTSFLSRFMVFFSGVKVWGLLPQSFGKPILGSKSHNERKTAVMVA